MTDAKELLITNRLIAVLPDVEREVLLARCTEVEVNFGDRLCTQYERYDFGYFPQTAFISLMASVEGHPPMEVGMVGYEGLLGASLLLGVEWAPQQAIVLGTGTALRIGREALLDLLPLSPVLLMRLHHYYFHLTMQITQTAVCTRFHRVEARLARSLLMSHDRAHADHFYLTHQILADMLGVQRSAVTIASGILKSGGLIDYSRGVIDILERAGLEEIACGCYAAERSWLTG